MKPILAFVLLFSFLGGQNASAQMPPVSDSLSSPTGIKVLSWNIYMLPPLIKLTGKVRRAKKIAEIMKESDYDVIVFQEAFHGGARRALKRRLSQLYPYRLGPANRKPGSFKTSSGVWMLAKTPLKELGSIVFTECFGFADCQARKGALLAETTVKGKHIQLMGTHIQAKGDKELKLRQVNEITERLLKPNQQQGVPQILCGDYNLSDLDTNAHNRMLSTLQACNANYCFGIDYTKDKGGVNDLEPGNRTRKTLDFILYKSNGAIVKQADRIVKIFERRWSKKHIDLSDHYAVEGRFEF